MKVTDVEIQKIKEIADAHFNGKIRLGIAAFLHGVGFVLKMQRETPQMDKKAISQIKGQITKADKKNKS